MVGFLREKLEQDRKFRAEDLQEQGNEREARERQHNQLITQNQQIKAQQSPSLATTADSNLGFVLAVKFVFQ